MYRNQGIYYRNPAPSYMGRAEHIVGRREHTRGRGEHTRRVIYPRERAISWGAYEVLSSAFLIALSLLFVVGIAVLVLHIVGFDSPTQLYGFDLMIEHFEL